MGGVVHKGGSEGNVLGEVWIKYWSSECYEDDIVVEA
jgi:hypothetical protein